jgi:hypothetical protein
MAYGQESSTIFTTIVVYDARYIVAQNQSIEENMK